MGIISKKFIKLVKFIKCGQAFCFIAILFCPVFAYAQNNSNDVQVKVNGKKCIRHIVEKGETIYGIAEKFNEKPKDIVFQNPSAMEGIHPGDTLMIPVIVKTAIDTSSVKGNYIYHEVAGKETLYSLAKQYGTTVGAIDSLNPEISEKGLQKGHTIRIPIVPPANAVANKSQQKQPIKKDTLSSVKQAQTNGNKNEAQAYKSLIGGGQAPADTSKVMAAYIDTGRKMNRYNIALIMPFASAGADTLRLSRLIEGTEQVPTTTQIAVDFYHGVKLALDSLSKLGFEVNLHVYNTVASTDTSSRAVDSILRNPAILKMNLIIGPPFPSNYRRVARFAGVHRIPIISPLSPENNVLKNNPWTSKLVPSPITEMEIEADYIVANYRRANIIIMHNRDANGEYYEAFKKRFKKSDSVLGGKDTLRHAESIGGVAGLASKINNTGVNVIVMPYQGAAFIAKFINELANSKYSHDDSLIIFGMQNWTTNDAVEPDNLDTLNFHFPSNDFVNYKDTATKKFITKYRTNYLSEPSYYSFEGYDATMFYGNLLHMHGTDIQGHVSDSKYRGLQTSFDMYRSSPSMGFENKAVYILEYKNYTEKLDSK